MLSNHIHKQGLSPIIKWAGGKEKEIVQIIPNSPANFENYYEPFVGGGAVYTSFYAKQYFINDKSEELISLYKSISSGNHDFYDWVNRIMEAWSGMLSYVDKHRELVSLYLEYRKGLYTELTFKAILTDHISQNTPALEAVLPASFIWHRNLYKEELQKNLIRKLIRMKKIEQERHTMPDEDVFDNIETAFMSALYMYFRGLYNDKELRHEHRNLSTALFVFIRNYAYSGMFRYNDKGAFNVPYGGIGYNHKRLEKKIDYYQSGILLEHFKHTTIANYDFEEFFRIHPPTERDFIFLDPPYDSEFSTYAENEFTRNDQERLAHYLCQKCKARWMMIIKYTPFIYSLYADKGLNIKMFNKKYLVSFMNRNDKQAEHLIIMNY
jgi:DNA adenine methylase